MAKRKETNVFSLSFLDIMSCGFGAVILIYIIIQHSTEASTNELNRELMAEAKQLEYQVQRDTADLAQLKNVLIDTEDEIITTEGMSLEIKDTIENLKGQIAELDTSGSGQEDTIEELMAELKGLEREMASLEGSVKASEVSGRNLRSIKGEGQRQYLTGLRVGGERILILLDASASMLDETIVNIIRMRNMPKPVQLRSEKWQRAIRTVEWILANTPPEASIQLVLFNTRANTLINQDTNGWISAKNKDVVDAMVEKLQESIPSGGTSLHAAFHFAGKLTPLADNMFLIVDGLPTQGALPTQASQISSRERSELFWDSVEQMPLQASMNIILFPMEGDPMAAPFYWQLAQRTGGSFLSPPEDWP